MDASALAKMLLEWEAWRRRLDELEAAIRDSVLQIERTQTVGNVRATYSAGRRSFDYRRALHEAGISPEQMAAYRQVAYDYRQAALDLVGQENVPFTQSPPSVSIKLIG